MKGQTDVEVAPGSVAHRRRAPHNVTTADVPNFALDDGPDRLLYRSAARSSTS